MFEMIKKINLQLFAENTQTTGTNSLSAEMKTFYSDYLIDNAVPKLVHDQFGQKHPIPKNGGKTIEFRKYSPLPKLLTPLTEGVTPDGQSLTVSTVEATVAQYGGYITLSDMLLMTAIDNNMVQATKLLGNQAGATLDTITREVLNGGTNVVYAGGVESRDALTSNLAVDDIKKAVRALKNQNAEKIGDSFVAIIHPDVTYDLTNDSTWQAVKDYDPKDWYEGEIGKIAGVRFVETTEAKVFHAENLTKAARNLTVASYKSKAITVDEAISAAEATALVGRKIILHNSTTDEVATIASATSGAAGAATITLKDAPTMTPADGDSIYPGEAGAAGRDVYSTLILGADAYGVTEIEGGGLEHITKQLGSAGTSDALNQRATVGWKATKCAERLVEQFMVRIESKSTFTDAAN